ncbi:hypothetical protein Pan153_31350 [Gimesia panareensis]|uniref:Uncharacterized protein n=1 Tax=Gimesia panareensis TaxID=2527978 RepID=A0A518FQ58_9PLAN|nr:hypothetical protein Pan153_31350 [Gimesia panareensis]
MKPLFMIPLVVDRQFFSLHSRVFQSTALAVLFSEKTKKAFWY